LENNNADYTIDKWKERILVEDVISCEVT